MKNQAGPDELGRLPRALLGLVLPPNRRDEFIGDLLEEARQHATRRGAFSANRWLWQQVLRSCPSLLLARLRRIPVGHAVAVPAANGHGTFAAFLLGGHRRSWRAFALGVSVLIHATVLLAASVRGMWGVDELSPPRVVISFWQDMLPAAPAFAQPAPPAKKNLHSDPPRPDRPPRRPVNALVPVTLSPRVSPGPENPGSGGEGPVSDDVPGTGGGCPPGASCTTADPPRLLPPQVGEKSCLSCPLPHLPPAFTRIGTVHDMLIRICVGADGQVASVRVLRGISPVADEGVIATVSTWHFSPYRIGERPVPFCYATRFLFSSQ